MFPCPVELPDTEATTEELEHACVLALVEAARGSAARLTDILLGGQSAAAIVGGRPGWSDARLARTGQALAARLRPEAVGEWVEVLRGTLGRSPGTRFVGVTDADYPANLLEVPDRPPYLFTRGTLCPQDSAAVAVVGSRRGSPHGLRVAADVAAALAGAGFTVVSGLASGIDTAAHLATLEVGGRTIAALGSGLDRPYPSENAELADRIARSGGLVSRFWPDAPPRQANFPLRNIVTSGLAQATVVIEAGPTSGARMQARLALEQRRPVILLGSLVDSQEWARRYAARPRTYVARDAGEVVAAVASVVSAASDQRQLRLF